MSQRVVFLHAALAAIQPLANYCARSAPELGIVNLLDDGLQGHFQSGDDGAVFARLNDLLRIGVEAYGAEGAMVTCSAASLAVMNRLTGASSVPVIKIDVPMAHAAVRAANRIGVLVTFRPTEKVTLSILQNAAAREGKPAILQPLFVPQALSLLNSGDAATHDRLMTDAAMKLVGQGAEALVLAQVSMAHLREPLTSALGVPVFESLSTSVAALRSSLS